MIRSVGAAIFLIVMLGSFALAQDSTPRVQIFGGYSLLHEDKGGLNATRIDFALADISAKFGVRSNFTGWNAEAQYNANGWVGIAVDFSGYSGVPFTVRSGRASGLPSQSRYAALVGPVISYRTKSKFTPYIHLLGGWERAHLSASTPSGAAPSAATSYTDFVLALGGGVDVNLSLHFSLRLGQADWYRTHVNLSQFYGSAYNSTQFEGLATRQKNWRVSTGVVVQF
jgi:hypothetical protein